ncbi:MAG: ATP-dependent Clp protease adaptor ClpS [Lachnospiraceae bacterium]|nr:ATP-dependent Clp protease adaptor ClpS [Lachnospiraceae bacterium]
MAEKTKIITKDKTLLKEPGRYKVVMYNDDFTPMDFVVEILMDIFHKNQEEAMAIMMRIHKGTKEIIGEYVYDIARTKTEKAVKRAREEGYPFLVKVEE